MDNVAQTLNIQTYFCTRGGQPHRPCDDGHRSRLFATPCHPHHCLICSTANERTPAMVRSTGDHWSALKRALSCCSTPSGTLSPAETTQFQDELAHPGYTPTVFGMDAPPPQVCPALRPSALFATPPAKISADAPFVCNFNTSVLATPVECFLEMVLHGLPATPDGQDFLLLHGALVAPPSPHGASDW